MGLCSSSSAGLDDRFEAAVQPMRAMLGKLKVGDEEAKKIYKRFEAVDKDKSGQIDVEEFFQGLRIEPTSFGERVFKVADVSHDGEIDFGEFFVAVYNFCSFSADSLLNFCFNIFDVDRSGSIERAEVKALVKMMRGNSSKLDEKADALLKKMDRDGDGEMSLTEFKAMNKSAPSMLQPAFELKSQLTEVICGAGWWKKQEASRRKLNLGDLIPLYAKLRDSGSMEKKLQRKADRMQKDGCGQGVITRSKGCSVHVKASSKSPILSKLKKDTLVDISNEKTVGEGAKKEHWYQVGKKRWVDGKNLQILDDSFRHSGKGVGEEGGHNKTKGHEGRVVKKKAGKKGQTQDGGVKGANYKVEDPGDWQMHTDSSTGKNYWYSKTLGKTTWKDPAKGGGGKKAKKKRPKIAGR
jgi:serine/threonine-protein phosphatase 2B regulatory subunit